MPWTNSTQRYRLWRDRDHGIIAGVCAGIADYIGAEPIVVRMHRGGGADLLLRADGARPISSWRWRCRRKPPALYASARRGEVLARRQRPRRPTPSRAASRKFRDLEERLGRMESQVTSSDFELHRKFRDLGR